MKLPHNLSHYKIKYHLTLTAIVVGKKLWKLQGLFLLTTPFLHSSPSIQKKSEGPVILINIILKNYQKMQQQNIKNETKRQQK